MSRRVLGRETNETSVLPLLFLEAEFPASAAAAAELHDSIFHLSPPAGERAVTTQESLMDAREREPLTSAKLLPPPKLSCGPFGSESR